MRTIEQELESLRRPDGTIKPEDVVEYAKDPSTKLHSRFEWDDSKAGAAYRLWQAREVIRVVVRVIDGTELPPTRVYVSLPSDRERDGGGYRAVVDVLSHPRRRQELLSLALAEAEAWQLKYRNLVELDEVFQAIRATRMKIGAIKSVRRAATPVPPKSTSAKSRHRMSRKGGQARPVLKG